MFSKVTPGNRSPSFNHLQGGKKRRTADPFLLQYLPQAIDRPGIDLRLAASAVGLHALYHRVAGVCRRPDRNKFVVKKWSELEK